MERRYFVKKLVKNKKGFTLVEILVVLAILAILIAIAVPTMAGALNDAKDKASMADARAAYIAYELKSATSTPSLADIKEYIDKTSDDSIKVGVKKTKDTDNIERITEFYYTDGHLGTEKYIKIVLGDSASVVKGTLPEGGKDGVTILS